MNFDDLRDLIKEQNFMYVKSDPNKIYSVVAEILEVVAAQQKEILELKRDLAIKADNKDLVSFISSYKTDKERIFSSIPNPDDIKYLIGKSTEEKIPQILKKVNGDVNALIHTVEERMNYRYQTTGANVAKLVDRIKILENAPLEKIQTLTGDLNVRVSDLEKQFQTLQITQLKKNVDEIISKINKNQISCSDSESSHFISPSGSSSQEKLPENLVPYGHSNSRNGNNGYSIENDNSNQSNIITTSNISNNIPSNNNISNNNTQNDGTPINVISDNNISGGKFKKNLINSPVRIYNSLDNHAKQPQLMNLSDKSDNHVVEIYSSAKNEQMIRVVQNQDDFFKTQSEKQKFRIKQKSQEIQTELASIEDSMLQDVSKLEAQVAAMEMKQSSLATKIELKADNLLVERLFDKMKKMINGIHTEVVNFIAENSVEEPAKPMTPPPVPVLVPPNSNSPKRKNKSVILHSPLKPLEPKNTQYSQG